MSPNPQAIPHDGWKSRSVIIALGTVVLLVSIATVCLFVGRPGPSKEAVASFEQWASFAKWIVPTLVVPLLGKMAFDKYMTVKANGKGS